MMPGELATQAVLYLHGFRSSPLSAKARIMQQAAQAQGWAFEAPDLNEAPLAAFAKAQRAFERLRAHGAVAVVGSSLGGFYAAALSARMQSRAVLINPAVRPWDVVRHYVGEQTIYGTDRTVQVRADFADELKSLRPKSIDAPQRILTLLTTGDEVLDWCEAAEYFAATHIWRIDGSDHGVSDFEQYVERVIEFLRLFVLFGGKPRVFPEYESPAQASGYVAGRLKTDGRVPS